MFDEAVMESKHHYACYGVKAPLSSMHNCTDLGAIRIVGLVRRQIDI